MQKDHLINIKDQTIEQLQKHIESLSAHCAHWVSRELKTPFAVQYSMGVSQPSNDSPATIPPHHTLKNQSSLQNLRYTNYLTDSSSELITQTKPDLPQKDKAELVNLTVIKNETPQQPPEPLNQTGNE